MKQRQLIYIPAIEPSTFLLLYFRGDTGRSYSLRGYTATQDSPRLTYAGAYPYTADEIISMARWCFDADRVSTEDVGYWREQIELLNQRHFHRYNTVLRLASRFTTPGLSNALTVSLLESNDARAVTTLTVLASTDSLPTGAPRDVDGVYAVPQRPFATEGLVAVGTSRLDVNL